jgi:hypothetical protein
MQRFSDVRLILAIISWCGHVVVGLWLALEAVRLFNQYTAGVLHDDVLGGSPTGGTETGSTEADTY